MFSAARPHHFSGASPTKPRHAERVRSAAPRITLQLLRLRNPAALSAFASRHPRITLRCYAYDSPPSRVCCSAAWLDLVTISSLRPRTPTHDIHIHSFDPTHKFEFQVCPLGRSPPPRHQAEGTAGGLYTLTPGGFENTEEKIQCSSGRFPAAWPLGQQREEQGKFPCMKLHEIRFM